MLSVWRAELPAATRTTSPSPAPVSVGWNQRPPVIEKIPADRRIWFISDLHLGDATPSDVFFEGTGGACTGSNETTDTVSGQVKGSCESLAFSLSLPDFDPTVDTLYAALVSLVFQDDGGDGKESLEIQLDAVSQNFTVQATGKNDRPTLFVFWNPLEQLAIDGRLLPDSADALARFSVTGLGTGTRPGATSPS